MKIKLSTVIAAVAIAAALVACGGKKTAPPKDDTPELRQNKADMMDRMNDMSVEEDE